MYVPVLPFLIALFVIEVVDFESKYPWQTFIAITVLAIAAAITAVFVGIVIAPLGAMTVQSVDTLNERAEIAIDAAAAARDHRDHRKAIRLLYEAIALFKGTISVLPYDAREEIAYAYLITVHDLVPLNAGHELRCALSELVAYADAADVKVDSPLNKLAFMSTSRPRLMQEYNALRALLGPNGRDNVAYGRILRALKDVANGRRPGESARILDQMLPMSLKNEYTLSQDLNYYAAWLYLAGGDKKRAVKYFYQVLLHGPSRPEMSPFRDEIEAARYLSTQSKAALSELK